jgi:hypothetical protein
VIFSSLELAQPNGNETPSSETLDSRHGASPDFIGNRAHNRAALSMAEPNGFEMAGP